MGFDVIHYSGNEYCSLLDCDACSFIGVCHYFRGKYYLYLNTVKAQYCPPSPCSRFIILVPPHVVRMEVCEQKFAIIQYFFIPLLSVCHHKLKWTSSGTLSGFDSTSSWYLFVNFYIVHRYSQMGLKQETVVPSTTST